MNKKSFCNYLFVFLVIILIPANIFCNGYEGKLLKRLEKDPNNAKTIQKLADTYYRWNNYSDAIKYYKKLESLNALTDRDSYMMLLCGIKLKEYASDSWEQLNKFRCTKQVKHKKYTYKFNYIIPEYWISVFEGMETNQYVIVDGEFKEAEELIIENKNMYNRNIYGIIYAAPDFLINYYLKFADEEVIVGEIGETGEFEEFGIYSRIKSMTKQIQYMHSKLDYNKYNYCKCYEFRRDQSLKNTSLEVKKVEVTPASLPEDHANSAGYILLSEHGSDNYIIHGCARLNDGEIIVTINAKFPQKRKELYLCEFDNFLKNFYKLSK